PIPTDDLFDDDHFPAFHTNLRGRSESRLGADLHPRIMPSVENLCILGQQELGNLREGYNDSWIKSIPFYGPRPQPDHTIGYNWSNFNEQERRKLGVEPTKKSLYTAREDIYFPFLTAEVKCGKQGLELADMPNAHSMTVHQRGIVDLARGAKRTNVVHRRVLGFSMSHDDNGARIYAHYPEVNGEEITYWRETLREFTFGRDKGKDRWRCYQFTINVCKIFALPFLKQLRELIEQLPDPATQSFGLSAGFDDISVQNLQDDASTVESQDESFKKPSGSRGLQAELRTIVNSLQRQLAQQRQDAEQQRQDTKERETALLTQLEKQRIDHLQQRQGLEQQQRELMSVLATQSKQIEKQNTEIEKLTSHIKELLQKRQSL
ncbi:hypothetical protein LTS08_008887, partial [Lithohypha guttulata]